jgi:hypothetical protein
MYGAPVTDDLSVSFFEPKFLSFESHGDGQGTGRRQGNANIDKNPWHRNIALLAVTSWIGL